MVVAKDSPNFIGIAKGEGARCVLGGERATRPECGSGWFVEPTIFTGVTNTMRIAREEVFGPVLSVLTFDTDDEAVAIANDTEFGLAAGIWTRSLARAMSMPKRLHAGTVWVNAYRVVSYLAPFGGVDGLELAHPLRRLLRVQLRHARAGAGAKGVGGFQHHHFAPLQRQRARHRQADHAGADDHGVDLLRTHDSKPSMTATALSPSSAAA